MKRSWFLVFSALLLAVFWASQTTWPAYAADCTWTGTSSIDWTDAANWSCGSAPSASDNVIIPNGTNFSPLIGSSTSIVGVTINANATLTLNANSTLTITGNLISNGNFSADNSSTVVFAGASNQTVSGSGWTTFGAIHVANSGGDSNNIVEVMPANFSANSSKDSEGGFLTLGSGIFKLSGNFAVSSPVLTVDNYTIPAGTGFWLNNPNFTVTKRETPANDNVLNPMYGLLHISKGNYFLGLDQNDSLVYYNGAHLVIDGGTLTISGGFYYDVAINPIPAVQFEMSGGTLTVADQGLGSGRACFDIRSTSSIFNMSGGRIIIKTANSQGPSYRNLAASTITGGVVQFGVPDNAPATFYIGTASSGTVTHKLPSLQVTSGITVTSSSDQNNLMIQGDLILDQGGVLVNTTANQISVSGSWINNGEFIAGSGRVAFKPATPPSTQNIGGTTPTVFYNLTIGDSAATTPVTVALTTDITVTNMTGAGNEIGLWIYGKGALLTSDHIIHGPGRFAMGADASLGIGSPDGIAVLPADTSVLTGSVQMTGVRVFPTTANYIYDGSTEQVTGNGLPATVNKLIIDNSVGVTLQKNLAIAANGEARVNGVLSLNGHDITVALNGKARVFGVLFLGNNMISGNGGFSLEPGGTIGIGSSKGITIPGTLTGNIQTTMRTYDQAATYLYNGAALQVTGNGLPAVIKDLIIDNTIGVTLSNSVDITGLSTLACDLGVNAYDLTIQNGGSFNPGVHVVSGSGGFTLANGATLFIGSPEGITMPPANQGNIQTQNRYFDPGATYVYSGDVPQETGNTLPDPVQNLRIENKSGVTLTNNIIVNGSVVVNGTLLTSDKVIIGAGSFELKDGATLGIGSSDGITASGASGNIQTSTRSFSSAASYTYNGSAAQVVGNGLPATVVKLTISNPQGVTINSDLAVTSAATVNGKLVLGTSTLSGTGSFTLANGATLVIGSPDGIAASGTTGNIQVSGGRTFNSGANYTYTGGSAQSTGSGLPAAVNNLTIDNPNGVTLSANVAVAGAATVNGRLNTGSKIISGAGSFSLSSGATLEIGAAGGIAASGASGSIQTAGRSFNNGANYIYKSNAAQVTGSGLPVIVNDLTIDNPANVTLSNDLTVNGVLTLLNGDLIVNSATLRDSLAGYTLTINGTLNTNGHAIKGSGNFTLASGGVLKITSANGLAGDIQVTGTRTFSSGASYIYSGNGSQITGDILPDSVESLVIESAADVTLSKNLIVNGSALVHGVLRTGDKIVSGAGSFTLADGAALSVGAAGGLAASGASGNIQTDGTRTFSSSASYIYNGSVAQAAGNGLPTTMANLTINTPQGVTIGKNISVSGAAAVNGKLVLGAFTLGGTGSFTLANKATLVIGSPAGITASGTTGNIQVSGDRSFNAGANYLYNGGSAQVTGSGLPQTVNNLEIDNLSGVTLSSNVTVNGALALTNGDLNTAALTLTLAGDGEACSGSGDVIGSVARAGFTAGVSYCFGNPYTTIRFTQGAPNAVTVRMAKDQPAGFSTAINRSYAITANGGGSFVATLRLHYKDEELNGLAEDQLLIYRRDAQWTKIDVTGRDTTNNWVENSNVTAFSTWTIAEESIPNLYLFLPLVSK